MKVWSNWLAVVAGLLGAAGVAAGALAAHGKGGPDLTISSNFMLFHASAICALALARPSRCFLASATVLAIGAVLFCGDVAEKGLTNASLFPIAAPIGGSLLIAGWLALAFAGLVALFRSA